MTSTWSLHPQLDVTCSTFSSGPFEGLPERGRCGPVSNLNGEPIIVTFMDDTPVGFMSLSG